MKLEDKEIDIMQAVQICHNMRLNLEHVRSSIETAIEVIQQVQISDDLRVRMKDVWRELSSHVRVLQFGSDKISAALNIKFTSHCVLLKKQPGGGFAALAVVDSNNLPEDTPEEFDLILPIPKPESLEEFTGW